uniref:Uncharacterized protein n=1 Tax=Rhizophora mucronata TaxID=61149 RepID=A0A2P2ND44_RHIMU
MAITLTCQSVNLAIEYANRRRNSKTISKYPRNLTTVYKKHNSVPSY